MRSGGPPVGVELAEADVVLEGGGHTVALGGVAPGQGDSWPTMVGLASGAAR
jgi:hypothetical protein